jgi:hypothetical protein
LDQFREDVIEHGLNELSCNDSLRTLSRSCRCSENNITRRWRSVGCSETEDGSTGWWACEWEGEEKVTFGNVPRAWVDVHGEPIDGGCRVCCEDYGAGFGDFSTLGIDDGVVESINGDVCGFGLGSSEDGNVRDQRIDSIEIVADIGCAEGDIITDDERNHDMRVRVTLGKLGGVLECELGQWLAISVLGSVGSGAERIVCGARNANRETGG